MYSQKLKIFIMIVIICFACLWRRADHRSLLLQWKKTTTTTEHLCFHHWFADTRAYSLIKIWCVACFEAAVTLLATAQCQGLKLWDEAWTCLSKGKKKDVVRISNFLPRKCTAVKALLKLIYNSQPPQWLFFKLAKKRLWLVDNEPLSVLCCKFEFYLIIDSPTGPAT